MTYIARIWQYPPGIKLYFSYWKLCGWVVVVGGGGPKLFLLRVFLLPREFLTPALSPLSWMSGSWTVPFSSDLSDVALQIGGLFHQGQCPYLSGHEARRVQHF